MSNIMEIEKLENRTPEQAEALFVHNQIKVSQTTIANGFAGLCHSLKVVHDRKLYKHLGYETLGEYTQKEHGIGERQAYKYVRTANEFTFRKRTWKKKPQSCSKLLRWTSPTVTACFPRTRRRSSPI